MQTLGIIGMSEYTVGHTIRLAASSPLLSLEYIFVVLKNLHLLYFPGMFGKLEFRKEKLFWG